MNESSGSTEIPDRERTQISQDYDASTLHPNFSNTSVNDYTFQTDWIVPVTINFLLLILTAWILLSLVCYGVKTKKWRRKQASNADMLNIGPIYTTVVFAAIFCSLHQTINLIYLNVGFNGSNSKQDEFCDMLGDTAVCFYFLILFSVNLFYWFRQRIFFQNEMLKVSYSKGVKILSFASIFVLFAGGLAVLIINNVPNNRQGSFDGCTFKPEESRRVAYWVPIVAITIIGQVVLLGLLAYAVKVTKAISNSTYKSIKAKLRFRGSSKSQIVVGNMPSHDSCSGASTAKSPSSKSTTIRKKTNSKKAVRKILKKTLLFGVISTVLDIFIQILIHYLTSPDGHRRYVTTVSNLNAFLNIVFLIFSFVQYKDILSSPFRSFERNSQTRSIRSV